MKLKQLLVLFAICLTTLTACAQNKPAPAAKQPTENSNIVEVLYFYGKQRCPTCRAIEANTKTTLDSAFAKELKNGTIVYRPIDFSEPANEKIATKYEVTWSSLLLVKHNNGKEQVTDLTRFGFANARKAPANFKKGLTDALNRLLK